MRELGTGPDSIAEAVGVLGSGGIVAYPTETFYGLGARYDNEAALARLFDLKGRPEGKPFSLIAGSTGAALELAEHVPETALRLMREHWPGPLTLVLAARSGLSKYIAPEGTVAVRVPGPSAALELARACGFAITATSANLSAMPPAGDADTVRRYFSQGGLDLLPDLLIDGGRAPGGPASTILDLTTEPPKVLRTAACERQL